MEPQISQITQIKNIFLAAKVREETRRREER